MALGHTRRKRDGELTGCTYKLIADSSTATTGVAAEAAIDRAVQARLEGQADRTLAVGADGGIELFGAVCWPNRHGFRALQLARPQRIQHADLVLLPPCAAASGAARRHREARSSPGRNVQRVALERLAAVDAKRAALTGSDIDQLWLHVRFPLPGRKVSVAYAYQAGV